MYPVCVAITVMVGNSALRSTWRRMTTPRGRPLRVPCGRSRHRAPRPCRRAPCGRCIRTRSARAGSRAGSGGAARGRRYSTRVATSPTSGAIQPDTKDDNQHNARDELRHGRDNPTTLMVRSRQRRREARQDAAQYSAARRRTNASVGQLERLAEIALDRTAPRALGTNTIPMSPWTKRIQSRIGSGKAGRRPADD